MKNPSGKIKIAILAETFAKNMGYMETMFPKYLARNGAEVHMITTDLPPYYQIHDFRQTYSEFSQDGKVKAGTVEQYDGYTLHVLPHQRRLRYMRIRGMKDKLKEIRPDCVYSMNAIGWIALEAALLSRFFGYKLFTGSHTTASVFPLARKPWQGYGLFYLKNLLFRALPGRVTSAFSEKCYGATQDCADIAVQYFGVQKKKIDFCPLGVDTNLFFPSRTEDDFQMRDEFRRELGVADHEILCVYTGRFSDEKNPRILADAVAQLVAQGEPFRAVFVGHGVQAKQLEGFAGSIVHPFTPVENLPKYYRAADIGVWPTQESTSMLDAAACGLPLIVNDTIVATERIEGNGLTYRLNDVNDMKRKLLQLKESALREELGMAGAVKMQQQFSWASLAKRRLDDFCKSLDK